MKKKYRIVVIGAGDRGGCYLRMLDEYYRGQVALACICDILPDRQQKAFEAFGFEAQDADWRSAIANHDADIVIVATPAYLHCDIASFAMQHGCDVLTEKPFDLDLAKCYALRDTARRTGKKLAIGLQYRNLPAYRAMKHMFDANVLGTNRMTVYNDMRMTRPKIAMHDAVTGNGGPMVDMACHLFDLMRWYYRCDPVSVFCQWSQSAACRETLSGIEHKAADTGVIQIAYADGSLGVITMNWGLPEGVNGQYMTYSAGSEGVVDVHAIRGDDRAVVKIAGGETVTFGTVEADAEDLVHAEKAVFDHFIADVENEGVAQASFEEGIVSLATSMAAMKSGALGRPVTIAEILAEKPTIHSSMMAGEA